MAAAFRAIFHIRIFLKRFDGFLHEKGKSEFDIRRVHKTAEALCAVATIRFRSDHIFEIVQCSPQNAAVPRSMSV